MSARTIEGVCLVWWLVLVWAGCCKEQGGGKCASDGHVADEGACRRDADCRRGFCDLGICAPPDLYWHYGTRCKPGRPPHAAEDLRVPANGSDGCSGYVCAVDGRCRSCQSDAECQAGSSDYKCLEYEDLPGRKC